LRLKILTHVVLSLPSWNSSFSGWWPLSCMVHGPMRLDPPDRDEVMSRHLNHFVDPHRVCKLPPFLVLMFSFVFTCDWDHTLSSVLKIRLGIIF
jgi:hypothetical protein